MKIAVLTSQEPHHSYLISKIVAAFPSTLAFVETSGVAKRKRYEARQWKSYALARYHDVRRRILGLANYRKRYFDISLSDLRSVQAKSLGCTEINSTSVRDVILAFRPDVTITCGCSILGLPMLEAIGEMVINIHGGYLPYYRGNHCFFFPLLEGELQHVGSTIHYVSSGIDTGDIIKTYAVVPKATDIPETLYCRAEYAAIDGLISLLKNLQSGDRPVGQPQLLRRKLFQTSDRTPALDLLLWLGAPMRYPWGWGRRPDYS